MARPKSPYNPPMVVNGVNFPDKPLAEFCGRHGVKRLSLFGSILRADFRPDSDVDVLVEFEAGRTPGMFGFGGMILELGEIIGRRIDLTWTQTVVAIAVAVL